jgi:hypothetical protein
MSTVRDLLGISDGSKTPIERTDSEPQMDAILVETRPSQTRARNVFLLANIAKDFPEDCFDKPIVCLEEKTLMLIHRLFSQLAIYFQEVHQTQPNGTYQLHGISSCLDSCKAKLFRSIMLASRNELDRSLKEVSKNLLKSLKIYFVKKEHSKTVDAQIVAFDMAWRASLLQRA